MNEQSTTGVVNISSDKVLIDGKPIKKFITDEISESIKEAIAATMTSGVDIEEFWKTRSDLISKIQKLV